MLVMSPRWREMYGQGNQKGPEGFLQKNTVIAKAKLAVGEEWATRTVENTSSVGDTRPLPLELLAGSLGGCSGSEISHQAPSCLTPGLLC